MAPTLRPCPSCSRHIRASDSQCPFCKSATPEGFGDYEHVLPKKRLRRAALATFGATLVLAGCASDVQGNNDGSSDAPSDVAADQLMYTDRAVYGAPTDVSEPDAGADVADDEGGLVAAYGLPPPDAAVDASEDSTVAPPYGLPADGF